MAVETIITWTRSDGSSYSKTEYNRISDFGRANEIRKASNRGETVSFAEAEMSPVPASRKEIRQQAGRNNRQYKPGQPCPHCHTYWDGDCRS